MKDSIVVSIDCRTYNHKQYIEKALDGFLMQKTNFLFEILIHDDASDDGTIEIIKKYEKEYPDLIKPIIQVENQYSKGNKRIAYLFNVTRAKGKYIAICEGDDYFTDPYKLQKQVDYMEEHIDCGFCFHAANMVDANEMNIGEIRPYKRSQRAKVEDVIYNGGGFISSNSIMYRRSIMNKPPKFYMDAPVGDYPIQIFLSTQKYGYYIDEKMTSYRYNSIGSWTNRMFYTSRDNKKQIIFSHNIIKMLESINEYFDYRYDKAIQKTIVKIEFNNLLMERKLFEMYKGKYKMFYKELPFRRKIRIPLQVGFPKLYQKVWILKGNLQTKLRKLHYMFFK